MNNDEAERRHQQYVWDGIADTITAWSERRRARDRCEQTIRQLEALRLQNDRSLVLPLVELSLLERHLNGESRFLPPQERALAILRTVFPCEGKSDPEVLEIYAVEIDRSLPQGAAKLRALAREISGNSR